MGCIGKVEAETVEHLRLVVWYGLQDAEEATLVLVGRWTDIVGSMNESPLDIGSQSWQNQQLHLQHLTEHSTVLNHVSPW